MVFCGFLSELVNCWKSRVNKNGTNTSPVKKMVRTDMRSKYSSNLTSYISACQKDTTLKSFDSSLHQRTNRVISSLAARGETQSLSLESLMEVYGFLLELNQEAVRLIIESREDVWNTSFALGRLVVLEHILASPANSVS
ncbi:hypothetical protein EUTSA_v10005400mg [Eutrema salsugineum]|uniref:Uncharacterized protein n=1 Tax=Eutrema salsugineum TaxID=72664 RepID=V4JZZ4_EUTSA|nr:hypothetical protein EUTSA_v10005400mg [Eutrema salsugineum]